MWAGVGSFFNAKVPRLRSSDARMVVTELSSRFITYTRSPGSVPSPVIAYLTARPRGPAIGLVDRGATDTGIRTSGQVYGSFSRLGVSTPMRSLPNAVK